MNEDAVDRDPVEEHTHKDRNVTLYDKADQRELYAVVLTQSI